jgi:nucleoside-diphosphate-sugar epimerase
MNILLSGASGFLGETLYKLLCAANVVCTIGRSSLSTFEVDLCHSFELNDSFDCVIHSAGKAHLVPKSQEDARAFWDVNVVGTRNLLKALEAHPPKRFVFISSVAVYGNTFGELLTEQNPVLARDPYGQSKIQAEAEVMEWCQRHGVICTILRLPLVYGENPPGNLKAMWNGIRKGYYFNIAGGKARKSMVRAEDVARFILPASEVGGIYHLTDGVHPSFNALSQMMGKAVGRNWIPNMPLWLARLLAFVGGLLGPAFPLNSDKLIKITSDLTFDDSLARAKFGWNPQPVVEPVLGS